MFTPRIELDGTHDLGFGPRMDQDDGQERYAYSRCMTCGCCLEACLCLAEGNQARTREIFKAKAGTLELATHGLALLLCKRLQRINAGA